MIHNQTITVAEQENLKPFLFVKDSADFKANDLMILSIYDEEKKRFTGEQIFFNIEKASSRETDKNIKAGVVFLNIKRIKNPLLTTVAE